MHLNLILRHWATTEMEASMAGDFKFIAREQLEFTQYAEEVIRYFECAVKKHLPPEMIVTFAECSNCDQLHVYAATDKRPTGQMIRLDIPPNMWKLRIRQ